MLINNLEDRIGYFDKDGQRHMPTVNVNGQDYNYPGSWSHLDGNRFVVVPVNFNDWALIEQIKAQLSIGAKPAKASKVKAAPAPVEDGDGD